jgi:carbon-monoxide dehydrogenase large subunit
MERIEDFRFLRGRGQFVDDLTRENVLHAAVLRSSVAHGRVRSIDKDHALALPGIHAVITAEDLGAGMPVVPLRLIPTPALEIFAQPMLARDKVRYIGEALAVVVADSPALAEDALESIRVDIEPLPAVADRRVSGSGDALLFEEHGSNLAVAYTAVRGDADAAFAAADYVRREKFRVQRHTALPMEPRGLLAEWAAPSGRLTVSGAAKVPFANRRILAKALGCAEDAIDLVENDVGGGFGARGEFYPEDFLIPFAARRVGRPVKWVEDRREHLLTISHAREVDIELEIACRRDGSVLALRGTAFADVGAYLRTNGLIGPRNVAQFLSGPYRVPNIRIESNLLLTNKAPIGTYRGPGRFEADFFRERLFDIASRDLGIDPVEFRRRNLVSRSEMPYTLATFGPQGKPEMLDSGDNLATLERCLATFGWSEKAKLQGQKIDGRYHGLGIGCFIEGGAAGPSENARMVLEDDGGVAIFVGSTSIGQGLETSLTQIAADALEMPMERIRLHHGSTNYVREGHGSFHSRSVVMGGSAILKAAAALKNQIRAAAGRRLNCSPAEVEIENGAVVAKDGRSVTLGALAAEVPPVEETFRNDAHTYSYGSAAAHVTVDPGTGRVELLDYVMVEDVGRIINPLTLRGQAVGAIVQGLGGALMEDLVYDANGQLLTGTLADYLIPIATDFPNIRVVLTEDHPSPINPLGAKGAGEGGTIPVGGVIANAVASALSSLRVEPRELPLSPSRVWHIIAAAGQGRQ